MRADVLFLELRGVDDVPGNAAARDGGGAVHGDGAAAVAHGGGGGGDAALLEEVSGYLGLGDCRVDKDGVLREKAMTAHAADASVAGVWVSVGANAHPSTEQGAALQVQV